MMWRERPGGSFATSAARTGATSTARIGKGPVRSRQVVALVLVFVSAAPVVAQDWLYTVRPGDTLWGITEKYLDGQRYVRRLQQHNNVDDARSLPPGSKLKLPIAWLRIQPAAAKALAVTGNLELIRPGSADALAVNPGTEFLAGDRIRTAPRSSITVEFADGSSLLVQQNSELVFDTLSAYSETGMVDTSLRLQRGRVENRVAPPKGPASRYRITTPAAVAATRGTRFRVGVDGSGELMRGEVLESAIVVTGSGVSQELPENFGLVTRSGEPPSEPQQLLPAPDLSRTDAVFERLDFDLQWPGLAGADAYRAQLFDADQRLSIDELVNEPRIAMQVTAEGQYLLRVRAVDSLGLEGRNAEQSFLVNTPPEPPVLLQPVDGFALPEAPRLQWSLPDDAENFDVQVAADPGFSQLVMSAQGHASNSIMIDAPLGPGSYYWRVAVRAANGELSAYSPPHSFRIQLAPPAPKIPLVYLQGQQLQFIWRPVAGAVRYEFEFAREDTFADILERVQVVQRSLSVQKPDPGMYAWRVRGVSAEGVTGPYSVRRVELLADSLRQITP